MAERASIRRHYHIRIGVIALACLLMGAYFLYDGFVAYPANQQLYQRYDKLMKEHPTDYQQRWYTITKEEGLSDKAPEVTTDTDIFTQKLIGFILVPFGLYILLRFLLNLRRWIEMDEEGLRDQSGRHIKWDDIKELDKTRWETKGIAVVNYEAGGRAGRLVLDDWKFDRDPIVHMVSRVDEALGNTPEPASDPAAEDDSQPDPA